MEKAEFYQRQIDYYTRMLGESDVDDPMMMGDVLQEYQRRLADELIILEDTTTDDRALDPSHNGKEQPIC